MPNKKIQVIDLTNQQQELKDLTNKQQELKKTIQELTILKKKLQQLNKKKQTQHTKKTEQDTKKKEQDTKKQTVKKKQDSKTQTQNTGKKKQDTKKQTQNTNKNCDKELLKIVNGSFPENISFPEFVNFILKKRKARLYLNVPYRKKDYAKGLKAKYDGHKRDWYIDYSNPESVENENELINEYLSLKKQYLIHCNRAALKKLFETFYEMDNNFKDHICSIDWSKSLKNVRFPYNLIEKWVSTDNDANIKFDDDTFLKMRENIDKIYRKWLESRRS